MTDFQVEQKTISGMLGVASKIPGTSPTKIIECVRLRFNGNGISVEVTNMESWLSITTPDFDVKGCSTVIIPCKQLFSIVSAIKDQVITFGVTDKKLTIKTQTSRYNLGSLPNDEWPSIPEQKRAEPIKINAGEFMRGVSFVKPSVAVNDSRYVLMGISITRTENGLLRLMSADQHRASSATVESRGAGKLPDHGIIVPREHIQIIENLISKTGKDSELSFEFTETRCGIDFTGDFSVSLKGRLIEGQFPEMDRLIPYKRESFVATMPREAVLDALRRMEVMSYGKMNKKSPSVKISFSNGQVSLSASGALGDANETFPATLTTEGEGSVHAGINVILPLLAALKGNEVTIKFDPDKSNSASILCEKDAQVTPDSEGFSLFMGMVG